jgi:hypothetical protein
LGPGRLVYLARMRRIWAIATAIVLCGAGIAGCGGGGTTSGSAHANNPFYGVLAGEPLPSDSEIDRLGGAKVGTLRINLAWGSVQHSPDTGYDWDHYDSVIGDAAKNGIRILATVYSSPTWAEPTPEYPPLGPALPKFQDFVRAAVERYGPSGSFWKDNPNVPKLPIATWQLWNEANSQYFWKPAPDVGQYVTLLRAFSSAVKGVDPGAEILLTGLFPRPPAGGPLAEDFVAEIYGSGGRGFFDAVAVHPYAANPQDALATVERSRQVMDHFGDSKVPIWVTEIGWASGGAPSGVTVGPARQAEYLTQAFQLLGDARERLNIQGVVWYSLNDQPGPIWVGHCGLFNLDGTPKPSWDALVHLTGGSS